MATESEYEALARSYDARYASGTAYQSALAFDRLRTVEIHFAIRDLAGEEGSDPKCRTLDVGSGLGGIATFWPHQNVVGVELSATAVDIARKNCPEVRYFACPIERLDPGVGEIGPYGMVVAVETIEHWMDVGKGLENVRGVLSQGGALVLSTPNRDSLHCRIGRIWQFDPPYCSNDHVHEFGYQELIDRVCAIGFRHVRSRGACLTPLWALEGIVNAKFRELTDENVEVNRWLNEIARCAPAEYAFIQCHRFEAA